MKFHVVYYIWILSNTVYVLSVCLKPSLGIPSKYGPIYIVYNSYYITLLDIFNSSKNIENFSSGFLRTKVLGHALVKTVNGGNYLQFSMSILWVENKLHTYIFFLFGLLMLVTTYRRNWNSCLPFATCLQPPACHCTFSP